MRSQQPPCQHPSPPMITTRGTRAPVSSCNFAKERTTPSTQPCLMHPCLVFCRLTPAPTPIWFEGSRVEQSWAWALMPYGSAFAIRPGAVSHGEQLEECVRVTLFMPGHYKHTTLCKAHCIDCCVAAPGQLAGKPSPATVWTTMPVFADLERCSRHTTGARHCSPRSCCCTTTYASPFAAKQHYTCTTKAAPGCTLTHLPIANN